jgi:hypothetical protein
MAQQSSVVWHYMMQISGLFVTLRDILIIIRSAAGAKNKLTWEEEIKRQKKAKYSKVHLGRVVPQSLPRNRRLLLNLPRLLHLLPRLLRLRLLPLPPLPRGNS